MILLYTTFPDQETAQKLCTEMVNAGLIKCANILNAGSSIYKWEGQIRVESEVYVYLKTAKDQIVEIEKFLTANHPYETYCLLQIDPGYVNKKYRHWVEG